MNNVLVSDDLYGVVLEIYLSIVKMEQNKGRLPEKFINPFTNKEEENYATVKVELLHKLMKLLEDEHLLQQC